MSIRGSLDKEFNQFWSAYPKRVAKGAARKALAKALQKTRIEDILAALSAQAAAGKFADPVYTPYPATWLNQERWDDELASAAPASAARRLAARWREACRAGDDGAKRAVREAAEGGRVPWAEVEEEVLRLREGESGF